MTNEMRRALAQHTYFGVQLLYCALVVKLGAPVSTASLYDDAEAERRYKTAKDIYIERRREAEQAVRP